MGWPTTRFSRQISVKVDLEGSSIITAAWVEDSVGISVRDRGSCFKDFQIVSEGMSMKLMKHDYC